MRQSQRFPTQPASVPAARRFARAIVRDHGTAIAEPLELMVSELATNCIKHAHSDFELTITVSATEIQVEVTDTAAGTPVMQSPGPEDLSGRGLRIVDMLADRWGVRPTGHGKTVWFTLAAPGGPAVAAQITAARSRVATNLPRS